MYSDDDAMLPSAGRIGVLSHNLFIENHAAADGGALYLAGPIFRMRLNRFLGNSTLGWGGALALHDDALGSWRAIQENRFVGNTAQDGASAIRISGGALTALQLRRLERANQFTRNTTTCGAPGDILRVGILSC